MENGLHEWLNYELKKGAGMLIDWADGRLMQ